MYITFLLKQVFIAEEVFFKLIMHTAGERRKKLFTRARMLGVILDG